MESIYECWFDYTQFEIRSALDFVLTYSGKKKRREYIELVATCSYLQVERKGEEESRLVSDVVIGEIYEEVSRKVLGKYMYIKIYSIYCARNSLY